MDLPVPHESEGRSTSPSPANPPPRRQPLRRAARLAFQTSRVGAAAFVAEALDADISMFI